MDFDISAPVCGAERILTVSLLPGGRWRVEHVPRQQPSTAVSPTQGAVKILKKEKSSKKLPNVPLTLLGSK